MHAAALRVELRIPDVRSLKEKRSRVRTVKTLLTSKFPVGVAEVGFQDAWQRSTIGISVVAAQPGQVTRLLHSVERVLHRLEGVEVLETGTAWMEET